MSKPISDFTYIASMFYYIGHSKASFKYRFLLKVFMEIHEIDSLGIVLEACLSQGLKVMGWISGQP